MQASRKKQVVYYPDGVVWTFSTARFEIKLRLEHIDGYQYDGDDEDGETQAQLDGGELVAFDSSVEVWLDDECIGRSSLGGSVYGHSNFHEFWTAHRDPNPANRNCTSMRGQHPAGPNVSICHYFPDMVHEAVQEARQYVRAMQGPPRIRSNA